MSITALDPDLRKSGVCTLDDDGNIILLKSMSIVELVEYTKANKSNIYAIENVNKVGAMYNNRKSANQRIGAKIAQDVGKVKATGTLIAQLIDAVTGREPMLAPLGLGKQVKNDSKLFNELSGWKGRSNEDVRDAWAIARWVWVTGQGTQL